MKSVKKLFCNDVIFLAVFIVVSITSNIYYYGRIVTRDPSGKSEVSSDFRVLWHAAYNLNRHILRDPARRPYVFKPFWFVDSKLRNRVRPTAIAGTPHSHRIYNKDVEFYHYRYSPFASFILMPLGAFFHQGQALVIWYIISDFAFLFTLLLMRKELDKDFGLPRAYQYMILWGSFLGGLRFYLMNISLGQTDILLAFLFVLFLMAYVRDRQIYCGVCLALIVQFKLLFLPILVYFLFIGKRRLFISATIVFTFFLFIPAYMLGVDKTITLFREWLEILGISVPSQILNQKNQSIVYAMGNLLLRTSIARSLFTSPIYLFSLIGGVLTLSSYLVMCRVRRSIEEHNEKKYRYLEISLLIIASLLFSPIAWKSYFINLVIPLGVTLCFMINCVKRKVLYWLLGAFFILACVIGTDLTSFIPKELSLMNISIGTLLLAFAAIYAFGQISGNKGK